MWKYFNPNPSGKRVGDCTVRAISCALSKPWEDIYLDLALKGFRLCDMPNADEVWGSYLHEKGFSRSLVQADCPHCYTIKDFCAEHPQGIYVMAMPGNHVVTVIDGSYYDAWDSGSEVPIYFWQKGESDDLR